MKHTSLIMKSISALVVTGVFCTMFQMTAFAGELTKQELIDKYADYAYAESHAHIAAAKIPITTESGAAEAVLARGILVPRNAESNETMSSTIGQMMADKEDSFGIYAESAYRYYVYHNPRGYQFFHDCFYEDGFFYITIENRSASIVGMDSDAYLARGTNKIDIPEKIGGSRVTRIEDYAFSDLGSCISGVKEINLPDTVETIGIGAFMNIGGEDTKIRLPQGLKAIQALAFFKSEDAVADEFGVIWLPDSLEFLGHRVFDQYYRAPYRGTNWGYLIRFPKTPVYMDSASWGKLDGSKNPTGSDKETLADVAEGLAAYTNGNPYPLYGEEVWNDAKKNPEDFQILLENTDKMAEYYQRFRDCGRYDLSKQYLIAGCIYNFGGGILYDEANIVTSDFSTKYQNNAPLYFEGIASTMGTCSLATIGDIDQNGRTNIADAVLLARVIAEDSTVTISSQGYLNADINCDGSVDAVDSAELLAQLAEL